MTKATATKNFTADKATTSGTKKEQDDEAKAALKKQRKEELQILSNTVTILQKEYNAAWVNHMSEQSIYSTERLERITRLLKEAKEARSVFKEQSKKNSM